MSVIDRIYESSGCELMVMYFSYGSNMSQDELNRFCRKHNKPLIDLSSKTPRKGILKGYKLDFNYHSVELGGGAANIEKSPRDQVHGVVFRMTDDDMITLDLKEGAPDDFPRILVNITIPNGIDIKNVVAYHANKEKKTVFTPPSKAYKQIIVDGAKAFELSKKWISMLEALPTQPAERES